ncbi:MAG: AAA family ATPase [Endomicrobiia bacterium]|nr:AAA family ATPase [Endomicrobiia bacterium]
MYLKSIEAVGFKSFAEKIKLEFGLGISVIVGPNGCGKSNISDAIKWVLGEQSAKSLRTSHMTDIIFNGTENRRPALGMSEVSLNFENTDGTLPIDFTEVTITRKLYRSGEGEYFINKSPCRLKDIRDLFAGTGIGADGYSIVEQRKVEFIIESKPEQRRELIEEAAGISKYKFRKEEALRKLERVRQDISRINDVLILHEEQVRSLESAARKAKQHQKLKEELRRAELSHLLGHIDANRVKIDEIKNGLDPLIEKRERNVADSGGILAETEKIKIRLDETDKEIIAGQEEASKLSSRMELADSRISQADELSRAASARIAARTEDNARLAADEERLAAENVGIKSELDVLETAAADVKARYESALKEHEETAAQAANLKKEEDAAAARIVSQIPLILDTNSAKTKLESDLSHAENRLTRTRRELEEAEAASLDATERLKAKAGEKTAFEAETKELEARLSSAMSLCVEASEVLADLRSRAASASQTVSVLEGEIAAMKRFEESDPVLSSIKALKASGGSSQEIRLPVAELFDAPEGRRDVILGALGEKALYVATRTRAAAIGAVEFLQMEGLSSLAFVVEEDIPETLTWDESLIEGAVCREPGDIKILRYLLCDTRASGGVIYTGAIVRGGAKNPSAAGDALMLIKSREEMLASEKTQLASSSHEMNVKSSEAARAEEEKNSLESELRTRAARIEWLAEEAVGMSRLSFERTDYVATLRQEIEIIAKDIEVARSEIARLDEKCIAIKAGDAELNASLAEIRARALAIAPESEVRRSKYEAVRAELYAVEPKIESLKSKMESIAEQRRMISSSVEQNIREIETWKSEITNHEKLKVSEIETLSNCREAREKLETELSEVFVKREEAQRQLAALEDEIRKFSSAKDEINDEIHNLEMEIRTLSVGVEGACARLGEEYEIQEAAARELVTDSLLDAEEMAELKKRIEVLGAVNLAAPEEYEALNKKYEFILAQKNDLDKAKSDLEEIIQKISKTTKEQLTETFARVRENFRNVYAKLFEGGYGDLILTDPDNILDSGVEIVARPPGKTTKSIQLSGGEKALTAVALLFAFYLVRPAPFCLLDEADASLDEANVERFLNLLETFTDRSQFLIITHNKRTMLRANVIYGITMEEVGVSKAISMKFERVAGEAVPA